MAKYRLYSKTKSVGCHTAHISIFNVQEPSMNPGSLKMQKNDKFYIKNMKNCQRKNDES